MGKVQDTISKISRRRRHHSSPEIALIIPSQQKPASQSFPTTYQAVSGWISAQTGSRFEIRVADLIKGLQHSNRLTNSPVERLKIMDLFGAEIQRTMPHLNTRYLGWDLPYALSAQFAFEQAGTLLTELSFGYKIALVDVLLGRGRLTQKSRVHAIYHAMKAIAECGLRHSQSYTSWPDKSWRDINTLLLLAEHENALDYPVQAATDTKNDPATIHRLYARLATFAVSRTEQFNPPQMDALFSAPNNRIQLLQEKPQSNATTVYSVALNSTYPPAPDRFCQYAQHHKVRFFLLNPIYTQSNNGPVTEPDACLNLTRTQFNKLNHIWSQSSPRQNARAIRDTPFYTQRGLKEIAASLTALSDGNTFDNPFSTAWTMVNESATGVGLIATENGNCSTCVGDLIGWQPDTTDLQDISCKVGIVRWLRSDSTDGLKIGLETIGQSVRSASIRRAVSLPSQYDSRIDALLYRPTTSINEPALVMVAINEFRLGETVNISVAKSTHESQMKLTEKVDQNGNFDCFAVTEVTVSADSNRSRSLHS